MQFDSQELISAKYQINIHMFSVIVCGIVICKMTTFLFRPCVKDAKLMDKKNDHKNTGH